MKALGEFMMNQLWLCILFRLNVEMSTISARVFVAAIILD